MEACYRAPTNQDTGTCVYHNNLIKHTSSFTIPSPHLDRKAQFKNGLSTLTSKDMLFTYRTSISYWFSQLPLPVQSSFIFYLMSFVVFLSYYVQAMSMFSLCHCYFPFYCQLVTVKEGNLVGFRVQLIEKERIGREFLWLTQFIDSGPFRNELLDTIYWILHTVCTAVMVFREITMRFTSFSY